MTFIEAFTEEYGIVYANLVEVIKDLPDEALNWRPYPDANTIAVLTTHLLGNQVETLRTVRRIPFNRNRPAEFEVDSGRRENLLALVADAQALLAELGPQITTGDLETLVVRGNGKDSRPQPGLFHLVHSIAHAREHVGQIWLTRDLRKLNRA